MNESLYLVWCPASGLPTKRHDNFHAAMSEAKRLCALPENEGLEFIVMRACQSVTYRTDPYITKCYAKKKECPQ